MPVSYSDALEVVCSQCEHPFTVESWFIVAEAERPDLMDRIRAGSLHAAACPNCGSAEMLDVPLLLYREGHPDPLLFSPAEQTDHDQDESHAAWLVDRLSESLADAWRDEWLADGLLGVRRDMLPAALHAELGDAIQRLFQPETWEHARDVVEAYPELVSPEADALLEQMIANARIRQDANAEAMFVEYRDVLRRCGEAGIGQAFAEKIAGA